MTIGRLNSSELVELREYMGGSLIHKTPELPLAGGQCAQSSVPGRLIARRLSSFPAIRDSDLQYRVFCWAKLCITKHSILLCGRQDRQKFRIFHLNGIRVGRVKGRHESLK